MKCSICNHEIDKQFTSDGKMFWDKGHNPQPVKPNSDDRCCSDCNSSIVLPARLNALFASRASNKNKDTAK